jgi:hypothetical protein
MSFEKCDYSIYKNSLTFLLKDILSTFFRIHFLLNLFSSFQIKISIFEKKLSFQKIPFFPSASDLTRTLKNSVSALLSSDVKKILSPLTNLYFELIFRLTFHFYKYLIFICELKPEHTLQLCWKLVEKLKINLNNIYLLKQFCILVNFPYLKKNF